MKSIIAIITLIVSIFFVVPNASAVTDDEWQAAYDQICPHGDAVLVPVGTDPHNDDFSKNILVDCVSYSKAQPDMWITYQVNQDDHGMPYLGLMTAYPMKGYTAYTMDGEIAVDPDNGIYSVEQMLDREAEAKVAGMLISPIIN